jgi:Holliday junction resolvase
LVMTQYARGRAREYRTMAILKEEGWLVSRSAASHGPVDVFAARDGRLLLIQVKSGRARMKKAEVQELVRWATQSGGIAELWSFRNGGKLERRTIYSPDRRGAT